MKEVMCAFDANLGTLWAANRDCALSGCFEETLCASDGARKPVRVCLASSVLVVEVEVPEIDANGMPSRGFVRSTSSVEHDVLSVMLDMFGSENWKAT